MSKFAWLVILLLIVGAYLTGIVELKVNKEKFFALPDITSTLAQEQSSFEEARAILVNLKRMGERVIVRSPEKRLTIALLYVNNDSKRLQTLVDGSAETVNTELLKPQSDLLLKSLNLVRDTAESAPVSVVAELKADSREAFLAAQEALRNLRLLSADFEDTGDEFTRLTASLEAQIGGFDLDGNPTGAVAGTQDENEETEISPEPLKF